MKAPVSNSLRRPARLDSGGFTLIELLLAMVIFAIVLTAVSGVFFGCLQLWKRTANAAQRGLPVQWTLATLRRDLNGLVAPGGTFAGTFNSAANIQGLAQQDVGLEIFTNSGVRRSLLPWGDIQSVAYVLRDPTNQTSRTGRDLVRVLKRNLLPVMQVEAEEQRLMGGVDRIDFSFYDGTSWRTSWNSTNDATPLPRAVKVEIFLSPEPVDPARPRVQSTLAVAPLQLVVPVMVVTTATNSATTGTTTGGGL